ncbi:hypothetical protein [Halobacterium wangiae]|uniref:hypothetical protein n=1 Tax=Halobacterium wangiae TaxID=2902623 RepID=UPI001E61657A|nr:hypothetical protein [Halobacterium wangiae]
MVSRRNALRTGSAVLLAVVAGCASGGGSTGDTTQEPDTTTEETTTAGPKTTVDLQLDATQVAPSEVPDGATVAVAAPDLSQLVVDAAESDGRVDLTRPGDTDPEETLVLGQFDYVEFRDETYDATASFADFAEEASYQYSLVEATDSEADGDVLDYTDLTESERAVADEMLDNGSFAVGHHEERPAAVETFEGHSYLRADGTTHRVRKVVGDYAAHHMLRLDPANPDGDARVVTVVDREPEKGWTDELRAAVAMGRTGLSGVSNPEALLDYLDDVGYVATVDAVAEVTPVRVVE